jgi:hypothetical protein
MLDATATPAGVQPLASSSEPAEATDAPDAPDRDTH